MKFKGTIVITDPCYIDTKDYKLWDDRTGEFDIFTGSGLKKHGFTNYIWKSTLYGDWSCTTYKLKAGSEKKAISKLKSKDTEKQPLGHFCADAGLVGVFLLDEVLKFNPDFKYPVNEYGCEWATVIENFDGEITYEVEDDNAHIKGVGNINFITFQTGF